MMVTVRYVMAQVRFVNTVENPRKPGRTCVKNARKETMKKEEIKCDKCKHVTLEWDDEPCLSCKWCYNDEPVEKCDNFEEQTKGEQ